MNERAHMSPKSCVQFYDHIATLCGPMRSLMSPASLLTLGHMPVDDWRLLDFEGAARVRVKAVRRHGHWQKLGELIVLEKTAWGKNFIQSEECFHLVQ